MDDYWEEIFEEAGIDPGDIDSFFISRDIDGDWGIVVEHDGDIEAIAFLSDDEMQEHFWDDLYWWIQDEGIDLDREVEYAPD